MTCGESNRNSSVYGAIEGMANGICIGLQAVLPIPH